MIALEVAPQPKVGMRLVDPAFPETTWTVVQCGQYEKTYIQREDGRLFHHTSESWEWAWAKGYLRHA